MNIYNNIRMYLIFKHVGHVFKFPIRSTSGFTCESGIVSSFAEPAGMNAQGIS